MPKGVYPRTKEHMKKIFEARKWYKHSEETKEKMRGKNHPNWKGGKRKQGGYILIHKPNHPFANCNGNVYEHRLVMEQILGRYLRKEEGVHHKNRIRNDNRPENLQLIIENPHYGIISCPYCLKEFNIR